MTINSTSTERATTYLIVAGARGRVGSAFRQQLAQLNREDIEFRLLVEANRTTTTVYLDGGPTEFPTDWSFTLSLLRDREAVADRTVFVDCTSSEEVASLYPALMRARISIVTPNKLASSGPLLRFLELKDLARTHGVAFLHETTVGAALPLLRPIADLIATGDRIRNIEGVLSGTLSFILTRVHSGQAFSEAVREAFARGLTEPDPTIDLSGADVGRKLLILLREAGHAWFESAVEVEPLIPAETRWDGSIDALVDSLRGHDDLWRHRAADSASRKRRLVYAATFDGLTARAAVVAIPEDHPLARARAGENVIVIHSERYANVPLTIAGPGAGPEVTASGVLAEVLQAAGACSRGVGGSAPRVPVVMLGCEANHVR